MIEVLGYGSVIVSLASQSALDSAMRATTVEHTKKSAPSIRIERLTMRVRGGGARASGMGHSRDPAVLCTRRVRFWHVSDLMREGGQVSSNAGPSPQPSPRSCLAGRVRKIVRG